MDLSRFEISLEESKRRFMEDVRMFAQPHTLDPEPPSKFPDPDKALTELESALMTIKPPTLCRPGWQPNQQHEDIDQEPDDVEDIWRTAAFGLFRKGLEAPNTKYSSRHQWSESPAAMTKALKPHQLEACGRAAHSRESGDRGFIIADDTGLGKTIESIALIVEDPGSLPNLIVAPSNLVSTWKEELDSSVARGHLKYLHFSGPVGKVLTKKQLLEFNVIIVSYDILRAQAKDKDEFYDRLAIQRANPTRDLSNFDKSYFMPKIWTLMDLEYERVIFDEAHIFRNPDTQYFKSCKALHAKTRLALTATMGQNSIADLFAYFAILRIPPFDSFDLFKLLQLSRSAQQYG
ncbi:hypothetical protein PV11_09527 [Exophiala sideris]|uniref:Helicase ATP-binding domain-containing protein n=1 Tax=Exophiala sideris TaxID=1016849 RepID=A0A0D1WRP3_9EURO|nr:hypothetical protein PV11_09527 [Exophiala sideris]